MDLKKVLYNVDINTNTTLNINTNYYVDTTTSVLTLTLPSNPGNKNFIKIIDVKNNFYINPVILVCSGTNKILENCSSYRLYESTKLVFNNNWYFEKELNNHVLPNPITFLNCDYGNIKNFCLNIIKNYYNPQYRLISYQGWRPATFTNGQFIDSILCPYNNKIYLLPYEYPIDTNTQIPMINYINNTIEFFSSNLSISTQSYVSLVYDPYNVRIWLVPYKISNQATWHYLDVKTNTFVAYTHGLGTILPQYAFRYAVYSPKQLRIYFSPVEIGPSATWYYINVVTDAIQGYTHGITPTPTTNAFVDMIYTPNNRIYYIPASVNMIKRTVWYYLDCNDNTVKSYTTGLTYPTDIAICKGIYNPINNSIYLCSQLNTGTKWYYINVETNIISEYNFLITTDYFQFTGFTYIPTLNWIFLNPYNNNATWYFTNCNNNSIITFNHGLGARGSFDSTVFCPYNNSLYFIPDRLYNISTYLRLDFGNQYINDKGLFTTCLFN